MKSVTHHNFVASLPCMLTGSNEVQAHHLLRVELKGIAVKNCDRWLVPLDYRKHAELHQLGDEIEFFLMHGIEYETVKAYARELCLASPCNKIRRLYASTT